MLVRMWRNWRPLILFVGMWSPHTLLWKIVWKFLNCLNIVLPYDPAVTLKNNKNISTQKIVH